MIDWTDAFDNSAYVEGSDQLPEQWAARAALARGTIAHQSDVRYGSGERETLDVFNPSTTSHGLVVFVHGGYWQRMDKSIFSHLASGCIAHGWTVAMVGYPLAPQVSIAEITSSVANAIACAATMIEGPVRLVGHSAGGHLVSRMACVNSPLQSAIQQRLARVVSVSGIHDLRPLTYADMNQTLQLTESTAADESPVLSKALDLLPVSFWVGAQERPELIRQTRLIAEAWEQQGAIVSSYYEPDKNHFNVIDSLQDKEGALTAEVLR